MNPALANTNEPAESNPIQIRKVLHLGLFVFAVAAIALSYVAVKMGQHRVGKEIRITENQIREVRADNDVLRAQISRLTSPLALRKRVEEGSLQLVAIRAESISRLAPPEQAAQDGVLRTAFADTPAP
jgi:hypothetical protein